jgi:hypothetical protein
MVDLCDDADESGVPAGVEMMSIDDVHLPAMSGAA